jgi:hypothetical protein
MDEGTGKKAFLWMFAILVFAGCSGGGGGSSPATPPSGTPTGSGGGHTITGQAAISLSQLTAASLRSGDSAGIKSVPVHFATTANSALPNATVKLYKISADGTETQVTGVTATTDTAGNYTLTNVPDAVTGTGSATDFYYEVRASSGGLDISAPVAPTADTTVNLSPESKIAAAMLSAVSNVPGVTSAAVLPAGNAIDLLRDIVFTNISQMSSFSLPSMAAGDESKVAIAAEAVSANNGNADKLMEAYDSLKEALYLDQNRPVVSEARIASYLERAVQSSCNYQQAAKLPQAAATALAGAFKAGTTFTLGQIANAYNHNGGNPAIDANGIVTAFSGVLNVLNTALTSSTDIPDAALGGIYISRGTLSSLSSSSSLEADQALLLLQAIAPSNQQCQVPLNYLGIAAELTGNTALTTTPSFDDIEVYHQRLQCGNNGSLEARVKLYLPQATTVSGVTISANGLKDQFGADLTSALSLTIDNFPSAGTSNWILSGGPTQACLVFGQTYTFTITADLSTGPITTTVTRTPVDVPEAQITLMAKDYSETSVVFSQNSTGQPDNPIKLSASLSTERPVFKWSPAPGEDAAAAINAPAGTQIKYLYDVSHFDITHGGPENRDLVNCPVVQNIDGKFFDKDYILSPIDCDVDRCNAAEPDVPHVCRIHVQTVLVDENNRILGWSAGADLYYCIEGQSNCP